jgi:NAD(P)-dependent dehydrogenase (short-subunit alcohol dehydrogenase family)
MAGKWSVGQVPALDGRFAVVTGANSGLGLETAAGLAQAGATTILACRDAGKARAACEELRRRAPSAQLEAMALDLADLDSVRAFAAQLVARLPRLDLLCNNAGVMALPLRRTRQGFEMQIGTNHLGHFALTGLLLPRLRETAGARIVTLGSLAHRAVASLDFDDLNWEHRPYNRHEAYARSKLANLLFHYELDRRLRRASAAAIAVAAHPGYTSTNIGFAGPAMDNTPWKARVMRLGNALLAQPAAMGALPTLYAATAAAQGGDYIGPDGLMQLGGHPRKVQSKASARDAAAGARLWALSEQLTGVKYL